MLHLSMKLIYLGCILYEMVFLEMAYDVKNKTRFKLADEIRESLPARKDECPYMTPAFKAIFVKNYKERVNCEQALMV
jgi:hypothetical protein